MNILNEKSEEQLSYEAALWEQQNPQKYNKGKSVTTYHNLRGLVTGASVVQTSQDLTCMGSIVRSYAPLRRIYQVMVENDLREFEETELEGLAKKFPPVLIPTPSGKNDTDGTLDKMQKGAAVFEMGFDVQGKFTEVSVVPRVQGFR